MILRLSVPVMILIFLAVLVETRGTVLDRQSRENRRKRSTATGSGGQRTYPVGPNILAVSLTLKKNFPFRPDQPVARPQIILCR
jgi:hypothetical protein